MNMFLIVIAVAASFVILLLLMSRGWTRGERGQSLDRLGDEHLHVPARRR